MGFDFNPADEDPHGECRREIEQLRNVVQSVICCPCIVKLCEHCNGSLQAVRGPSVDPAKYMLVARAEVDRLESEFRLKQQTIDIQQQESANDLENIRKLLEENTKLQVAIRKHRDSYLSGDNKCWKDNEDLYNTLPEGYTPPERDTLCELGNCERYIASCHDPRIKYVSPQREIEELRELLRIAYRQISGDYTDGGEYRDDRTVITMLSDRISSTEATQSSLTPPANPSTHSRP